jgi:hypothetical protein
MIASRVVFLTHNYDSADLSKLAFPTAAGHS